MTDVNLGEQIRKARMNADLSIKDCAEKLGITANYLSIIERGKRNPSKDLMSKIRTVTNMDGTANRDIPAASHRENGLKQAADILAANQSMGQQFIQTAYQDLDQKQKQELIFTALNLAADK